VRYVGQSSELTVPWSAGYREAFHRAHERRFGYADRSRATEVVAIRVRGIGITAKPVLQTAPIRRRTARPARLGKSRFGGRLQPTTFYRWDDLRPGDRGQGAAVIAGREATVVVPPAFRFAVDAFANLVLTRGR
jgi:N-methylhydantoinase A